MKNFSVIFVNTTHEQGVFMPADATLGIATLQYWLAVDGVADTVVFPENEISLLSVNHELEKFLNENSAPVFAVSCWSNAFTIAKDFAGMIRYKYPDSLIIGGGAHFHSRENIIDALNKNHFDIVFRGGADPFFKFCTDLLRKRSISIKRKADGLAIKGTLPSDGIHYLKKGKPVMSKHGVLSRPVVPVLHTTEEYGEITAIFNDRCGNNCDYCTVFKNCTSAKTRDETEVFVKESIDQLSTVWTGVIQVSIMDSSPFLGENRPYTFDVIKRLASHRADMVFSVFADPSDLDEAFTEFVKNNNITTLFIGRDRIDEDPFIGRRLGGRLRSKEQLDDEYHRLMKFINALNGSVTLKRELFIGYIASPFDSAKDAEQLISELSGYGRLTSETVTLQPNVFILNPYKGTSVERKCANIAWDIADFSYPYPNVWKGEDVSMIWLELLRLVVSPVFSTGTAYEEGMNLLKCAANYSFGTDYEIIYGTNEFSKILLLFINDLHEMEFGKKFTNLDIWADDLVKLYRWGLLMVATIKTPAFVKKHGVEKTLAYIKDHDAMITLLQADVDMIKSSDLTGTWYGRYSAAKLC